MRVLLAIIALDLTIVTGIEVYEFYLSLVTPGTPEITLHVQPQQEPSTVPWKSGTLYKF